MNSFHPDTPPVVLCRVLPHGVGVALPAYATEQATGMDLAAAVSADEVIAPGQRLLVPTGIQVAVPEGYEGQVRPRSGLASRNGIVVANSPGTVDPDYRGEVKVILHNLGSEEFVVRRGMRIAQLVVAPVARAVLRVVEALPPTRRGEGGFGHTGE